MAKRVFWNIGWRYLLRHPWQSVLMILGITLGVAVVVAIDLANASASRAFDLSTEAVAGRATHQITGGPDALDQEVYTRLRRAGIVSAAAPLVSEYVFSPQLGNQPVQLLGIDPFAEPPFRSYLGDRAGTGDSARPAPLTGDLVAFLTRPGAVLISEDLAEQAGLALESSLTLEVAGRQRQVFIAGLLRPGDRLSSRALQSLILADISTAQELTGRIGKLDRIDLILPDDGSAAASHLLDPIQEMLPADALLQPVEARTGAVEQMTAAFRVNLTALSLLALVVGLFLIYNTMTFSVVQRRPLFGVLRCLGVTRREVFALVLSEALIAGLLGSIFGLLLGIALGQGAVRLVTQTINDLFFVLTVRGIQLPAISLLKGALLGIVATLLTAAPPAWEAASAPPRAALSRSGLESKAQRAVGLAAAGGALLLLAGAAILLIPTRDLVVSFAGTFAVVIGVAMLAPIAARLLMRLAAPGLGRAWGTLGRMAPRDAVNSLSRTSIAVAALMVAVSVTIGVSLMVGSFRQTVIAWLSQTLQGDIYISTTGLTANETSAAVDPQVVEALETWPGVAQMHFLRSANVDSPLGRVHIAATSNLEVSQERSYFSTEAPIPEISGRMQAGAVIISEPFANRFDLPRHGASLTLYTDSGPRVFPVAGIFYDYASTQGTVIMLLETYRQHWRDPAITSLALYLEPGVDVDQKAREIQGSEIASLQQRLQIRPNLALRREVLEVFDRTFAITGALQLLTTLVAFIGILSALLSLQLERQRELGILRAIGLTVRQLWALIMLETGLLGAVAGLLAMPTGYLLALILVYIINRRSFGWTLQMQLLPEPFLLALLVSLAAALLAAILPAYRTGRIAAADAIRFD
jgi:putative ABC transport system permease protein